MGGLRSPSSSLENMITDQVGKFLVVVTLVI